eukprot:4609978-Ditylum_brightwellii.AAC.1
MPVVCLSGVLLCVHDGGKEVGHELLYRCAFVDNFKVVGLEPRIKVYSKEEAVIGKHRILQSKSFLDLFIEYVI